MRARTSGRSIKRADGRALARRQIFSQKRRRPRELDYDRFSFVAQYLQLPAESIVMRFRRPVGRPGGRPLTVGQHGRDRAPFLKNLPFRPQLPPASGASVGAGGSTMEWPTDIAHSMTTKRALINGQARRL